MKSVKEIKQVFEDWQREDIPTDDLIVTMVDALMGVTERLEAITRDGITGDIVTLDDPTVKALRREGMIEALRWSLEKDYVDRFAAITRLENGGEL